MLLYAQCSLLVAKLFNDYLDMVILSQKSDFVVLQAIRSVNIVRLQKFPVHFVFA